MKILGISGKRGTGKSLLAKFLVQNHGFQRFSLADDLKERCKRDFFLAEEEVRGCLKENHTHYKRTNGSYLTPRDIMIRMGVFYRSIDPLFWCKKLDWRMVSAMADKVVIDDIRFLNEIHYFKDRDAKFVRLEREEAFNPYKAAMDDLSECELDNYKEWLLKLPAEENRIPEDLEAFAEEIAGSL